MTCDVCVCVARYSGYSATVSLRFLVRLEDGSEKFIAYTLLGSES